MGVEDKVFSFNLTRGILKDFLVSKKNESSGEEKRKQVVDSSMNVLPN